MKTPFGRRLAGDRAQDAIEYLLVAGAFVVAFAGAMLTLDAVMPEVLGYVCPSADTANPAVAVGSCLGLT